MDNNEHGTNLASLGTDCISRHVAIDAIERAKQNIHHNIERAIGDAVCEVLDEVENGIKQLPSTNCSEFPNNSDTISRQAAIDAIEHITTSMSICVNSDECHGMKRMQRQAVIKLANMPTIHPEPHWIPVTKDTPKEVGTYMCTCYDAGRRIVTLVKWQPRTKTWNLIGSRAYWKVIAWCNLPEPYKGVTT